MIAYNEFIHPLGTGSLTISSDSDIGNESIIVSNNAVVTISNVMLKGTEFGTKVGSGIINSATLTLINSTVSGYVAFSDSPSNSQGGGITNSGTLTLINSPTAQLRAIPAMAVKVAVASSVAAHSH